MLRRHTEWLGLKGGLESGKDRGLMLRKAYGMAWILGRSEIKKELREQKAKALIEGRSVTGEELKKE